MPGTADWAVGPAGITLPPFAGPNDPAIDLGGTNANVPPELIAFYSPFPCYGCMIYRQDATHYQYTLLLVDPTGPVVATGINNAGLIIEASRVLINPLKAITLFGQVGFYNDPSHNTQVIANNQASFDLSGVDNFTLGFRNWVPAWTQSTSNPTLNDGTLSGVYRSIGNGGFQFVDLGLTIGAGTVFGTGAWQLTLPFTPRRDRAPLVGLASDVSTGQGWPIVARLSASNPQIIRMYTINGDVVGNTNPFTWAAGDVLTLAGTTWAFVP